MIGDPDRDHIAARWLIQQNEPHFSDEQQDELARWLVSSRENCVAYLKLVRSWRRMALLRRGELPMPYGSRPYKREKPGVPHRKRIIAAAGDTARVRRAFGKAVRDHRRARELSQETFAVRTGVARKVISKLENGRMSVSFDSFVLLARALDMTPMELIDDFERVLEANASSRTSRR